MSAFGLDHEQRIRDLEAKVRMLAVHVKYWQDRAEWEAMKDQPRREPPPPPDLELEFRESKYG